MPRAPSRVRVPVRIHPLGDTALLAELGRPTLAPGTVDGARAVYERTIARADTAPLVAVTDGEVVGFLSLEFRDR